MDMGVPSHPSVCLALVGKPAILEGMVPEHEHDLALLGRRRGQRLGKLLLAYTEALTVIIASCKKRSVQAYEPNTQAVPGLAGMHPVRTIRPPIRAACFGRIDPSDEVQVVPLTDEQSLAVAWIAERLVELVDSFAQVAYEALDSAVTVRRTIDIVVPGDGENSAEVEPEPSDDLAEPHEGLLVLSNSATPRDIPRDKHNVRTGNALSPEAGEVLEQAREDELLIPAVTCAGVTKMDVG